MMDIQRRRAESGRETRPTGQEVITFGSKVTGITGIRTEITMTEETPTEKMASKDSKTTTQDGDSDKDPDRATKVTGNLRTREGTTGDSTTPTTIPAVTISF